MEQSEEGRTEVPLPSSQTLHGIFDALPIAVTWAVMPGAVVQFTNREFQTLFGYPPGFFQTADQFVNIVYIREEQRALARAHWDHFQLTKSTGITEIPDIELEIRRYDGMIRTVRHRGVILHDMKVAIAVFEDISEQKRLTEMLDAYAHLDPLTGLANRRSLEERWREIAGRDQCSAGIAFLMVDLDGFKHVNDTHGHDAGDAVLRTVANRLTTIMRETDLVCRLGGDEFGVLLPILGSVEGVEALCDRIIRSLEEPMAVNGVMVQVGASIGACRYPEQAGDIRDLLLRADRALYQVKATGKGCWRWYTPDLG